MAQVTLRDAAELLKVSVTSLRRRIAVLKLETGKDEQGRVLVDVQELEQRWHDRQAARPPRRRKNATLTMVIDEEERDEIDGIAEHHELSTGEASRRLLRRGMVGYYDDGRKL